MEGVLTAAVDPVDIVDCAALDDDQLAALIVDYEQQQARLDAARAEVIGEWDARKAWAPTGAKNGAAWIARTCRLPKSVAARYMRHARHLRTLPATTAALTAGEITSHHVARIIAADTARTADALRRHEATLVGWAATKRWDRFCREVGYWEQEHDPDGPEPRPERRRVNLSRTLDGCWALDGWLDPIAGTILHTELSRLEEQLFLADWKQAKARLGRDPSPLELARTPSQRRADALAEMAQRSATAPADGKRPRPLVSFVVGVDAFARMCELLDGTVLRPDDVVPLLDGSVIERIVFDGPDRPIATSPQRSFTGTLRRVLDIRDRGCTHPFCDEPPDRCQGDHIDLWAHGGITDITNGRLRCGYHNRLRNQRPPPHAA